MGLGGYGQERAAAQHLGLQQLVGVVVDDGRVVDDPGELPELGRGSPAAASAGSSRRTGSG